MDLGEDSLVNDSEPHPDGRDPPPIRRQFPIRSAIPLLLSALLWTGLAMTNVGCVSAVDTTDTFATGLSVDRGHGIRPTPNRGKVALWWLVFLHSLGVGIFPTLMLCSITFRLRSPRPPVRELLDQPGFLGCLAPLLVVPLGLLVYSVSLRSLQQVWIGSMLLATPVAWVLLFVSGRWKAEPGWIDRFGRGVSIAWMIWVVVYAVLLVVVKD